MRFWQEYHKNAVVSLSEASYQEAYCVNIGDDCVAQEIFAYPDVMQNSLFF